MEGKNKRNIPKKAWGYIILAISAIVVIVSILAIEDNSGNADFGQLWQNILLSVACSIAASILFIMIQKIFADNEQEKVNVRLDSIEKSLRRQNELYDNGIQSIHPKFRFDKEDVYWKTIIEGADSRLDLIGHSLSNWFKPEYKDAFCGKILQMIEGEKKVRIILSSNEFELEHVKRVYRGLMQEHQLNKLEKTVLRFYELLETVSQGKRANLKVYVTGRKDVTYMYIRTDTQCIVSPYILSSDNNHDSFLLELSTSADYPKAFSGDFDEMLAKMKCIDFASPKVNLLGDMKIVQYMNCENRYSGSNWNREISSKYVYKDGNRLYEVGYFEHYRDEEYVKSVIEIPVSYGCPSKCHFCASSGIQEFYVLSAQQMQGMFEDIYYRYALHEKEYVLLTLTGTGDIFYNAENVKNFLMTVSSYPNLHITLSSCLWTLQLLEMVENLSARIKIRNVQLTYISSRQEQVRKLIPAYQQRELQFQTVVDHIANSRNDYYRINYILIKDFNDTREEFDVLKEKLIPVKDKVVVRISKLNETGTTKKNELKTADIEKQRELCKMLEDAGIRSYIFYSEKNDNMNCGQLITERG